MFNLARGVNTYMCVDCFYNYNNPQAQNICITFIERLPNVLAVGPALYMDTCYTNVSCLRKPVCVARQKQEENSGTSGKQKVGATRPPPPPPLPHAGNDMQVLNTVKCVRFDHCDLLTL